MSLSIIIVLFAYDVKLDCGLWDYKIATKIGLDTEKMECTRYRQGYNRKEIVAFINKIYELNGQMKVYCRSASKVKDLNYLQHLLKKNGKSNKIIKNDSAQG